MRFVSFFFRLSKMLNYCAVNVMPFKVIRKFKKFFDSITINCIEWYARCVGKLSYDIETRSLSVLFRKQFNVSMDIFCTAYTKYIVLKFKIITTQPSQWRWRGNDLKPSQETVFFLLKHHFLLFFFCYHSSGPINSKHFIFIYM